MCGILGVIAFHNKEYHKRKEFMKQGLIASSLRGTDGTGMFLVPHDPKKDDVLVFKKPIPSYDFVGLEQLNQAFMNMEHFKYAVGHTRSKTRGDIKTAHTHPFVHDHITLVHNGSITNSYKLAGDTHLEVDSMAVAKALSETTNPKSVLERIEGAFALVWYNAKEDTLCIARNEDRPLFYGINAKDDMILFASELRMLDWIAGRTGSTLDEKYELGPMHMLTFTDSIKGRIARFKKPEPPANNWMRDQLGKFTPKTNTLEGTFVYGKAAAPYLFTNKLSLDQEVVFSFSGWELRSGKSRHGNLKGVQMDGDFLKVLCQGVAHKSYTAGTKLKSTICGAYVLGKEITILVANKVEEVPAVGNLLHFKKPELSCLPPADYPREESIIDLFEGVPDKQGPLGLITGDEFAKLVEDGCASCAEPIAGPSRNLRWTVDGHPICAQCAIVYKDSGALLQ